MDATDLDFEEEKEHWNVYTLSDGTTLKVRLILVGVKRLKRHGADGNPIYVINTKNVVRTVDVPKGLRAKPKPSTTPVA